MFKVFTVNRKTIVSVDFDRINTCPQICSYCYVQKAEILYKNYKTKIQRNNEEAKNNPEQFADMLNKEYLKLKTKELKKGNHKIETQSIRLYGSGDFIPHHILFIKNLQFPFYIISKSLTYNTIKNYIDELILLPNLTSLVLSFDETNLKNYINVKNYYNHKKIKFSYTGTPDQYETTKKEYKFNIFFNTVKNKIGIQKARQHKEQCPCDTKLISVYRACTKCNKCWR